MYRHYDLDKIVNSCLKRINYLLNVFKKDILSILASKEGYTIVKFSFY